MVVHYLYNSSGVWIAFRVGKNLFEPRGEWAGWMPWDDDYVVAPDGKYLGTITGNRLFRLNPPPRHGFAGYPVYPGPHPRPQPPEAATVIPLPETATDIEAV